MGNFAPSQWKIVCHAGLRNILFIFGVVVSTLIIFQICGLSYETWLAPRSVSEDPVVMLTHNSSMPQSFVLDVVVNDANGFEEDEEDEAGNGSEDGVLEINEAADFIANGSGSSTGSKRSSETSSAHMEIAQGLEHTDSSPHGSLVSAINSRGSELEVEQKNLEPLQTAAIGQNSTSALNLPRRWKIQPVSFTQMNLLLLQSVISPHSMKPRWSSLHDRELLSAKVKIEKASVVRNILDLDSSVYRNISKFKRSYELMEQTLKVYIYKEGVKPLFHQSKTRGIYASEGWFMKLLQGNRKFVVRNPRKAHLFYLPFSSLLLRNAIGRKFSSRMDVQRYLNDYIQLIAGKYKFWNRTDGSDHFLVACHDWAPKFTEHMKHCLRSLCNANAGKDFRLGKDTSLPVTYIRSAATPVEYLGGRPPSERPILAFFAGGMHGYLRPILVHLWGNKEPDMKIFGPMPRDIEGKRKYREYMKSSRYCICARGYQVHTPRVVESIFHECVPVIISDNYVPPFFEILNWEAFTVFVLERDVGDLRNILLSIPEERYLEMQSRVKMVRQHFLWHKNPVKYDLFHMILHSIWYNRVFNMRTR